MEFDGVTEFKFLDKTIKGGSTDLSQQQHFLNHCTNNNNNLPGVTMEIANQTGNKTDVITTSSQQTPDGTKMAASGSEGQVNPASCVKECASCSQKIWDRFLLHAMDRYWHTGCLKCSCCHAPLGDIGATCYAKGGMVLCKNDYLRLFGKTGTCTGCGQGIPANEFVMKVQGQNFYHLQCFTCVVCQHRLVAGDRYCHVAGHLLCELDYPKVIKGTIQLPPKTSNRPGV